MHRYSEYKDSGIDWLGEIPSRWSVIPVKRLYQRVKRTNFPDLELLSVYRDYGVIPKSSRDDNNNKESDDLTPYQLVKVDDLVMNKMKAWQGSIAVSEYEGIVSPAYYVYSPRKLHSEHVYSRYVHYLLRSPLYISQYMARSKGIRVNQWDLDAEAFERVEILLPPKSEQEEIYSFLDRETSRINNLIAEKQTFINLLKEKRQALISHVVTKGLSPSVQMKDSGIEWIGEVPQHWQVIKFSHFVSIRNGQVDPTQEPWASYVLIAPNHIESASGKILKKETAKAQGADSGKYLCKKGEVIYSKIRPALAKACICQDDETICSADMYPLSSDSRMIDEYLLWLILSNEFTRYAILESDRVAMPKINRESLAKIKFPVPPVGEQELALEFINKNTAKLEKLITETNSSIGFLKEHRTALISAAVTGKIDVRNYKDEAA